MRDSTDRVKVRVHSYFIVDLDLERVEDDPRWKVMGDPPISSEEAKERLFKYINQYVLSGPQLMTNAPCTNGPSDVWVSNMEIINERSNAAVPETNSNRIHV